MRIYQRKQQNIDLSDDITDDEESVEYMMGEWKYTWEIKGCEPRRENDPNLLTIDSLPGCIHSASLTMLGSACRFSYLG
jgi:hypothetical protein